jgi:hypothetical protein
MNLMSVSLSRGTIVDDSEAALVNAELAAVIEFDDVPAIAGQWKILGARANNYRALRRDGAKAAHRGRAVQFDLCSVFEAGHFGSPRQAGSPAQIIEGSVGRFSRIVQGLFWPLSIILAIAFQPAAGVPCGIAGITFLPPPD